MAAEPVMVPVFVVGLPQLPASILALPDIRTRNAALGNFQARAHIDV